MKEIARWSRDEVAALLRAWREGLEHQPNPLRRGKLNGFVSERFHALRACYEPFRTACSIVYKKKYWKSMVQFICEYQEQSGDWFALSPAERKRCFGELKTTSYKFTDLEQDTAFEIAQLITLEDGTPGLADLVYVHSGRDPHDRYRGGSNASESGGDHGAYSPPGAWTTKLRDDAPPPPLALEHDDEDDYYDDNDDLHHRRRHHHHLSAPHMDPYMAPPEKRGYRYGDYHDDDASVTSSDEAEGGSENHMAADDDSSELQYQPLSASSTPRAAAPSPLEFGNHPLLPASVSRYHQQREEADDAGDDRGDAEPPQYTTTATMGTTPDLLAVIGRLEHQAAQLKDMVQQERAERRRARAQQEAQQQAWEAEQAQHAKVLAALQGSQLESQASDKAKQAQHDEWAKVLQQLQLDRQERIAAQSARSADESERQTLLEEIGLSQRERHKVMEEWKIEQEERAAILEQIRQERVARNQDNSQWRVLLAQIKAERAASDAKAWQSAEPTREDSKHQQSVSEPEKVPLAAQNDPKAAPKAAPAPVAPAPVAGAVSSSSSSKQEGRAGGASSIARPPIKRSRPPATAEDESRPRGHRVRRV